VCRVAHPPHFPFPSKAKIDHLEGSQMKQPSKPLQLMRGAIENHLTMLTLGAVVVGVSLRYFADPHGFSNSKDILKELGNFILITFVVAFIYENFVNYRYKHEFIHEIERILSERFNLPLSKVYLQRPELNDKAALMKEAKQEIIEFGTALRTFTSYMQSNMSFHTPDGETGRYRDLIETKLSEGVSVKCLLLNPTVAEKLKEIEADLEGKISTSLIYLKQFEEEINNKKLPGKFEVILYQAIPHYAAIVIDGSEENGIILVSPYIPGTENAESPAFKIEKTIGRSLFISYWDGVRNIIENTGTKL
jgi:hypothetical protein